MFDPYEPLTDMYPYYMGDNDSQDPDEAFKGCLITGLILLGFMALLVIAYSISKII